jgi:hypothetical protein
LRERLRIKPFRLRHGAGAMESKPFVDKAGRLISHGGVLAEFCLTPSR